MDMPDSTFKHGSVEKQIVDSVYAPYRTILSETIVKYIVANVLDHPNVNVNKNNALTSLDQANDNIQELLEFLRGTRMEVALMKTNIISHADTVLSDIENTIKEFERNHPAYAQTSTNPRYD